MMNKTVFSQTDSRWGGLAYPGKGCTVGGSGCGLVALAHLAIEYPEKEKWDPRNLRPYMLKHGYAIAGQGTRWEGITETLKYLGYENVVRVYDADPMSKAWEELNKGDRMGILLFNSHVAPNGIQWTTNGHYVAFTKYRYKNGKHQFYCKDSGWRQHTGWYSYENSMKGCLPKLWIVKRVKYGDIILKSAKALAWKKGTASSKYAFDGGSPTNAFKLAFDKVYPKHKNWGKGPRTGASCDVFVGTVIRHSGVDKKIPRGFDEAWKYKPKKMKRIVKKDVDPYSVTKPGDIIYYWKTSNGSEKHVLIRGYGCLYEAQYQKTYGHVNKSMSKIKEKRPKMVIFRYTGK